MYAAGLAVVLVEQRPFRSPPLAAATICCAKRMSAVEPEPPGEGMVPDLVAEAATLCSAEVVNGAVCDALGSFFVGADGPAAEGEPGSASRS